LPFSGKKFIRGGYQSIIGSLIYPMIETRPAIAFVLSELNMYLDLKRIIWSMLEGS